MNKIEKHLNSISLLPRMRVSNTSTNAVSMKKTWIVTSMRLLDFAQNCPSYEWFRLRNMLNNARKKRETNK